MKDGTPQGLPLGEALRAAHSPAHGCPPPEVFLSWETGDLTDEERRRLDEHVASCPACAAERDLARLFEPPTEDSESSEDMAFILARLEEARPGRPQPAREAKVVPFPTAAPQATPAPQAARRRSRFLPAMSLAAAAMLALVVGVLFQSQSAPPLPEPGVAGEGEVTRGADLTAVAPLGELAAVPAELRWEEIPTAESYRWRLLSVDGSVVWEETASGSPVRLPRDLLRSLHPAVTYTWTVEALDDQGDRIAASEPARFRVRPAGENGTTSR